jgi:hypothetical protein
MKRMFRQGDILLISTENTILGSKANTDVLREGTLTGHHHRIKNGQIYFQEIDRNNVFAYVVAFDGCELFHDEHKTIKIPVGTYEVRRQREVNGYVVD